MARCRDAIQNGRWAELIGIVQGIAAKAQRIVEVGRATIENASDQSYKTALSKAVEALERGTCTLASSPGPFPTFQCCMLKAGGPGIWGQGYTYIANEQYSLMSLLIIFLIETQPYLKC